MDNFETLYGELFDLFYDSEWGDNELAAFKMQVGDDYENGPLFVGRAPNGWASFYPSEWDRDKFIQDPMLPDGDTNFSDWLANNGNEHYKISRSQFWQDAKRIFYSLYDGDFSTDIAYSNLCKISLQNSNPNDEQCWLQLDVCRKILLAEITELEPECIVFMTGYNGWAECFFDDWNEVNIDTTSDEAIECSGDIAGYPFVVIRHPQGKAKDIRDRAVEQTIEYFQRTRS